MLTARQNFFVRRVLERMVEMIPADAEHEVLAKMRTDAARARDLLDPERSTVSATVFARTIEPILRQGRAANAWATTSELAAYLNSIGLRTMDGESWSEASVVEIEDRIDDLY